MGPAPQEDVTQDTVVREFREASLAKPECEPQKEAVKRRQGTGKESLALLHCHKLEVREWEP